MTNQKETAASRREFLKTSMAVAAGAATLGGLSLSRSAYAAGSDIIKIGLIGCGDRGPGAARDAMSADPGVRLVAMTDVFIDRVNDRRARLQKDYPAQVQVDDAHCFSGLDGYKNVIQSADVVLIACSAKYHPVYLRAAIEAGKHVFVEKPHAIDPVGIRHVAASCKLAEQKKLCVMSGLQSRFDPGYQETIKRIHDGAIGDIVAIQETWLRPPYRLVDRNSKLSEMEYQFLNQYHFSWLSGDDVPQTLTHNLDRATWAMQGKTPVKAHGMGGRAASFGPVYGNVFDHHSVVYEYDNGVRLYALCHTQNGCYEENSSIYLGTKGQCHLLHYRIEGQNKWTYSGPKPFSSPETDPYKLEHKALFAAIRAGTTVNAGSYMVPSTTVAVMGQLACYSGQELTWERVSKSDFVFLPKPGDVTLEMEPPVKPDAKGWYPVPMPGLTEFNI